MVSLVTGLISKVNMYQRIVTLLFYLDFVRSFLCVRRLVSVFQLWRSVTKSTGIIGLIRNQFIILMKCCSVASRTQENLGADHLLS